jgi:hypothetical protein
MSHASAYWFRAKRYGWGWGLPLTWQGWATLAAYTLLLGAGMVVLPAARHPVAYVAYVVTLTAGLIAICYLKGEPPKWRWGRE